MTRKVMFSLQGFWHFMLSLSKQLAWMAAFWISKGPTLNTGTITSLLSLWSQSNLVKEHTMKNINTCLLKRCTGGIFVNHLNLLIVFPSITALCTWMQCKFVIASFSSTHTDVNLVCVIVKIYTTTNEHGIVYSGHLLDSEVTIE